MKKLMRCITCVMPALVTALMMGSVVTGCMEKDLYDPDYNPNELPSPETYPDFSTESKRSLNVDYGIIGSNTPIELYAEYPFEQKEGMLVKKSGLMADFAAYTDDNGRFNANISLAAFQKRVYLCTSAMGLPQCIELDITPAGINFNLAEFYGTAETGGTRTVVGSPSGTLPYLMDESLKLFSLCQWGRYGTPSNAGYLGEANVTGNWIKSLQRTLWGQDEKPGWLDNSKYLVDEKYTNISIATKMKKEDGTMTDVIDAKVSLTFISESAWYQNVLGYYYYPTDKQPSDISQLKKYILLPNVSIAGNPPFTTIENSEYVAVDPKHAPLQAGSQVVLQYFDENGKASDHFPAGYTIGWFVISDGFKSSTINTGNRYIYSNASYNSNGERKCIALNDKQTGRVVVGFEDGGDTSYDDILFFVESDPRGAIVNPDDTNKPSIDDEGEVVIPDKTMKQYGTLAFEDLWPKGGDYDMNDVVVEYQREVTFDKDNNVKKIVDTFTPVQRKGSATYNNAFAYQVDGSQLGTWTSLPEGTVYESETNSFILFPDARAVKDQSFEIVRTFASGTFKQTELKDYNPFIIVKYVPGNMKRTEVHLPKQTPTDYADKSQLGSLDDAYYMNKKGKYPFAIRLMSVLGFKQPAEGVAISDESEYPLFSKWVESGCKEYTDWYKRSEK